MLWDESGAEVLRKVFVYFEVIVFSKLTFKVMITLFMTSLEFASE